MSGTPRETSGLVNNEAETCRDAGTSIFRFAIRIKANCFLDQLLVGTTHTPCFCFLALGLTLARNADICLSVIILLLARGSSATLPTDCDIAPSWLRRRSGRVAHIAEVAHVA